MLISLRDRIALFIQGSSIANVVTLMSGSASAQLLLVASSPLITRLYSPDDMGLLACIVSLISISATGASGRYELAILLPAKDEEAINVTALAVGLCLVLSALALVLITLFYQLIIDGLNVRELGGWLYLVPLGTFLAGFYNVLTYLGLRHKEYHALAAASIYRSVVLAGLSILLGLLKLGANGLLISQLVSSLTASVRIASSCLRLDGLVHIRFAELWRLARRYSDFPKYNLIGTVANDLSFHLVSLFILSAYSVATLGLYALVDRVLVAPMSIVGSAIGQVFIREASEEKRRTGSADLVFVSTLKRLMFAGVPIFAMLFVTADDLFATVFGESWRQAGQYTRILLPMFFLRFVVMPLTATYVVFEKQRGLLLWQITLLTTVIGICFVSWSLKLTVVAFLQCFSVNLSLYYLGLLVAMLRQSRGRGHACAR